MTAITTDERITGLTPGVYEPTDRLSFYVADQLSQFHAFGVTPADVRKGKLFYVNERQLKGWCNPTTKQYRGWALQCEPESKPGLKFRFLIDAVFGTPFVPSYAMVDREGKSLKMGSLWEWPDNFYVREEGRILDQNKLLGILSSRLEDSKAFGHYYDVVSPVSPLAAPRKIWEYYKKTKEVGPPSFVPTFTGDASIVTTRLKLLVAQYKRLDEKSTPYVEDMSFLLCDLERWIPHFTQSGVEAVCGVVNKLQQTWFKTKSVAYVATLLQSLGWPLEKAIPVQDKLLFWWEKNPNNSFTSRKFWREPSVLHSLLNTSKEQKKLEAKRLKQKERRQRQKIPAVTVTVEEEGYETATSFKELPPKPLSDDEEAIVEDNEGRNPGEYKYAWEEPSFSRRECHLDSYKVPIHKKNCNGINCNLAIMDVYTKTASIIEEARVLASNVSEKVAETKEKAYSYIKPDVKGKGVENNFSTKFWSLWAKARKHDFVDLPPNSWENEDPPLSLIELVAANVIVAPVLFIGGGFVKGVIKGGRRVFQKPRKKRLDEKIVEKAVDILLFVPRIVTHVGEGIIKTTFELTSGTWGYLKSWYFQFTDLDGGKPILETSKESIEQAYARKAAEKKAKDKFNKGINIA